MAVRRSSFLAVVLLLASVGLWCSCASPPCPESCTCQRAPLLNCSSSGLSSVPLLIQDSVTELDLSHNLLSSATLRQPHPNLSKLWLGNNSIPHLSLCIERTVRGRHFRLRSETGSGSRCLTWAPSLQLLSAERNLLEQLPEGLDVIKSLKILQLSFNRISSLEPGVLDNLRQLQELHLQHNLITNLHPQMFQNLDQLRILDLMFNRLTNMQQLTYLTLHNIGADVKVDENRWRCDCNMRGLRRQMAYGNTRGPQSWNIICTFPFNVSGKDLLQLDEEDLKCLSTENNLNLHQDVTVYSGAEILLSCSAKESVWWTPSGRASVSQHEGQLLISDFSEGDEGLYVCVSEEGQVLSVFNLQISKTGGARKARSLPGVHGQISLQGATNGRAVEATGSVTQSNLALAVCLSIFFTFLVAFILGVLARPCLERLWGRVIKKKAPPETHTAPSVQQRQYDNQAFSSAEEPEEIEPHRERRVTFSSIEITEESNMQYYDTVASADQESISSDKVFEYQAAEVNLHKHPEEKQRDDSSSDDLAVERLRNMKFEHIPDPDEIEERRSLSSSSNSSQNASEAYQMTRDHAVPKSLQLVEDLLQKTANLSIGTKTKIPQISMKEKNEFLGSSSLHTNKTDPTGSDVSQDDEELFEFSDGGQSPSVKASSLLDSFSSSHQVNNSYDSKRSGKGTDVSSSSDSSDSDKEPMHNKIKKRKKVAQISKPETRSPSSNSESEEKMSYVNVKGRINIERLPFQKSKKSNSNGLWPTLDLEHIPRLKRRLDIKALLPGSDSSSCSDGEDEPRGHGLITNVSQTVSPKPENQRPNFEKTLGKLDAGHLTFQEFSPKTNDPDGRWPSINLQDLPRIKRRINIKAPTADSDSSSSGDSEDETRGKVVKQKKDKFPMAKIPTVVSPTVYPKPENSWPPTNLGKTTDLKKSLDIKALSTDSDSSSSSDSDNEREDHMTQKKQKELHISKLPTNVTPTQNAETQWPAIDIGRFTRIKRRLDIKAPTADSDSSSSSESEDETRGNLMKEKQEELLKSKLPNKASPRVCPKTENLWPPSDLGKTIEFKKSVDIKALSTDSDSSSSSESDSERKDHMTQKKQEELHISKHPASQTASQTAETQWPALDLGRKTQIKRRLDIKAPTADSDSSSSSETENESRGNMIKQKQEELLKSKLPNKASPTVCPKPANRWPPPDRGETESKNSLDIKAPSTDSESSSDSDSDKETKDNLTHTKQEELHISKLSTAQKAENQWPVLDLGRITHIKRRLDIKAPTADSNSSSSSDSDNEREDHMTEKKQKELHISKLPTNVTATTQKAETQWPALDIGRITRIKRRLDIKAPTADSDSSSSSESEDETRGNTMKQKQEELLISKLPAKVPPSVHAKPEKRWSVSDLGKTTEFKRPLDIKPPPTDSDSSSSSDSDNEREDHMTEKKEKELHISKLPTNVTTTTQKAETQWPALDIGRITRIKRRLDIKAPTADSDSSSSSESEDETRGNMMKQKQEELLISKLPAKVPPSVHAKPEKRWSVSDLGKTTEFKRPLDIKPPPTDSDSSSSSDSDNEREDHMTEKKEKELHISKLPTNVTTTTQKAETQWPALDIGRITRIKRRLDIKAPTADSDSSSSSESEDETRGNMMKQKQEELLISKLPAKVPPSVHAKPEKRWSVSDLGKTTEFKRPLDIKPPPTDSDSSSSSDSDNEREDHMTEKKQKELHISKLPTNVTTTQKAETQWPALDIGRITRIKRRLDIKAPTADSDSSSSSESEDETRGNTMKQKQEELLISKLPVKVPPSVHAKPEKRWSVSDLGKTTEFKRPLDIKPPPTYSDSSSSSDSDNERKDHMTQKKQEELHISKLPTNVATTLKKETQWPAPDLGRITRIKRRLDIKAPTADSDSLSTSKSEDETRGNMMKQKQDELLISKLPAKVPPSVHARKPEKRWSVSDLGKSAEFKRPLDLKPPPTDSDSASSSSSDSDNERKDHMTQKKQEELHISKHPASQTASQKAESQWPAIDIGRITQIKRRLDIKAPTADSDSSSSSESEQKELHMSRHPIKTSQMVSQKQGSQWPSLDLWRIPQFKRRLDIKAPTADSKSSSSSDSENETGFLTENRKAGTSDVGHLSSQETTTETYDPDRRWPTINIRDLPRIKRHLVIKAPSPIYHSSSSSDTKDVIRGDVMKQKQEELLISRLPAEINQTMTPKPHSQWPALDLGQIPSIKRRLDIKASIQHQSSLSSNESAGMTADPSMKADGDRNLEGVAQPFTGHVDNKTLSPLLHLGLNSSSALGFKQSESQSSSSESEDENSDHQTKMIKNMSFTSTASEQKDIRFQKVKGTNNSYSTKTDHNIRFEKYTVISGGDLQNIPKNDTSRTSLEVEAELQSRWTTMNLGVSRFRKRLEITSHATEPSDLKSQPPPDSPLSPSSESGSGRRDGLKRMAVGIKERVHRGSSPVLENYQVNVSPTLKDPDDIFTFSDVVKQRINQNKSLRDSKDSTRPSEKSSNSSSSSDNDDETKDHSVTDLSRGVPHIKRRLNIKAPLPELNDTLPFFSQNDNLTKHTTVQSRQASTIQGQTEESLITYKRSIFKSSLPNTAFPKRSQTVDVIPNLSQGVSNDRNTSLASKTAPNTSFDDIIKRKLRQSRPKTDGDLLTTLQSDATLIHTYSSLGPEGASPSPSDIPYVPGNSSENLDETFTLRSKGERKGLNALKAMSEQRRNWEVESDKDTASLFDAQDGSIFSHSQSEKSIEVFSQQSQIHSPSMSETKREIDLMLLYGVPRYKRHSIGDSLTEASLPDPTTPQPND